MYIQEISMSDTGSLVQNVTLVYYIKMLLYILRINILSNAKTKRTTNH